MKRQHKLLWASSYDRGIHFLLEMWPDIIAKYPDATLDVAYGWDTFVAIYRNNPERMAWHDKINDLMSQPGITHRGRLGKEELKKLRQSCGIWTYPTSFTEINCITALECQQDGCVPCVIDYAALQETVQSGIKIPGDIYDKETQKLYLEALLELMGDENLWEAEQARGITFAQDYEWDGIAEKWDEVFREELPLPKVTIYTPTIRTGWEEMMAKEIAEQTYQGEMEWIIVDDYKGGAEDRNQVFYDLSVKYALDLNYIEGSHEGYKYGLSHANNIGWKAATGELFISLQDCMMIEPECVEDMVNLYRKNPDCLIAAVDLILNADGSVFFKNPRIANLGIRFSDNPFDFEMNCGAIPMKILKDLNGWYELLDDGLGYDNTEIANRALAKGYGLIIDESNLAKSTWHEQKGVYEGQDERYKHIIEDLPVIRDEKLDKKI